MRGGHRADMLYECTAWPACVLHFLRTAPLVRRDTSARLYVSPRHNKFTMFVRGLAVVLLAGCKAEMQWGKTSERGLSIDIQKCVFVLVLVQMFCGSSIPNQILHALNKHEDFNRRTKGEKHNINFILVGIWVLVFVLHDQNFNYGCQTMNLF